MDDANLMLMAVEPLPRGDWLLQAEEVLSENGMQVERRSAELLVWQERQRSGNLSFSDGWAVRSIWLAPDRRALGVTSKRLYFVGTSTMIDDRPEHIVVSGMRPQAPSSQQTLESQWTIVQMFKERLQSSTTPVKLQRIELDLGNARVVQIGANSYVSPPKSLNMLYREHGFDMVPRDFSVSVCPLESVSGEVANEFARRLDRACAQRHVAIKVGLTSAIKVTQRLSALKTSGDAVAEGHCVLFVLASKNEKARAETLALFELLEANGVPFRRAYADDLLDYSIPDQLPSLLIAAGGRPHRSPIHAAGMPVWTVGVDLGHRVESPVSTLALTLVSPDGGLVGAWTMAQPRDETARVESVSALLTYCKQRLLSFAGKPNVVVLRDGRMFENENANLYREVLKTEVSLFEYRKYGNPQIVRFSHAHVLPCEPLAAVLREASTMFVITAPPRDDRMLPSVAKVIWRREWNGLALDPVQIASILAASAVAPGLGLHPRQLPAAIYWADGIASMSNDDLRFRGMPVNSNDLN